jgi:hypothetical protein
VDGKAFARGVRRSAKPPKTRTSPNVPERTRASILPTLGAFWSNSSATRISRSTPYSRSARCRPSTTEVRTRSRGVAAGSRGTTSATRIGMLWAGLLAAPATNASEAAPAATTAIAAAISARWRRGRFTRAAATGAAAAVDAPGRLLLAHDLGRQPLELRAGLESQLLVQPPSQAFVVLESLDLPAAAVSATITRQTRRSR